MHSTKCTWGNYLKKEKKTTKTEVEILLWNGIVHM